MLREHITEALCGTAFKKVRSDERQRRWSLAALVQFWTAVILRAPPSLSHALSEMREGREPLVPRIQATDEALFQRCRDLSWKFFREISCRFIECLVAFVKPRFCRLRRPRWKGRRFTTVHLEDILVQKRTGVRRRRRFCKARRQWKSITHIRGGRKLS